MEGKLRFTIDWATVSVKMVGTLGSPCPLNVGVQDLVTEPL